MTRIDPSLVGVDGELVSWWAVGLSFNQSPFLRTASFSLA